MLSLIKRHLSDTCPSCKHALRSERRDSTTVKQCPNGHYKAETHDHLGVTIIFAQES